MRPAALVLMVALASCGVGREADLPGGEQPAGDDQTPDQPTAPNNNAAAPELRYPNAQPPSVEIPPCDPPSCEIWRGYLEADSFSSGSDTMEMHLRRDADGNVVDGLLIVGEGPTPPTPTDPNVGYPPDATDIPMMGLPGYMPYDGFPYSLWVGQQDERRLVLHADFQELWLSWCEIQPYYVSPDGLHASCVSFNPDGGTHGHVEPGACTYNGVPYDCTKQTLCTMFPVCECSAAGCTVELDDKVTLDLTLVAGELVGTISVGKANVRFSRTQP